MEFRVYMRSFVVKSGINRGPNQDDPDFWLKGLPETFNTVCSSTPQLRAKISLSPEVYP